MPFIFSPSLVKIRFGPVPWSLGCRDLSPVSSRTPNSLQYLSCPVLATIAVRTVRISAAHSAVDPCAAICRTFLILRQRRVIDFHASHLCQKSLGVQSLRERFC